MKFRQNGTVPQFIVDFGAYEITEKVNIENNKVILTDTAVWNQNKKGFIGFNGTKINNNVVNIKNNKIECYNQTNIQKLVALYNIQDLTTQKIFVNNNDYNNFRYLAFSNNLVKHIIVKDNVEYTENSTI